ncbi:MAG: YXWGXW repeat-containing protein, partial [Deltaproteobacteria bacterium]|nr:YXWGXW repeat-containing protein [Deltaproteobacteria bacterium]
TAAAPVELVEIAAADGDKCPDGMTRVFIVDHRWETSQGNVLAPKQPLAVDVWSHKPIHLEDVIFLVHQTAVRADLTPEAWRDYREASERWYARYRAHLDRSVAAGRTRFIDSTAHSTAAPPPPRAETQPPRPSTNAAWLSGYWHRDNDWIWIPGFWRVPEEDIVAERTVEAPRPPPVARAELAVPRPSAVTVWTPGYWAWDGRGYVWIEGAWRVPPRGGVWIAPTWRPRGARVVFMPGGWSVRTRR